MSTAANYMTSGDELWPLAYSTVYDAREVAIEFNSSAVRFLDEFFRALKFIKVVFLEIVPVLRRLVVKQQKLIEMLQFAQTDSWHIEECRNMSDLLQNLVISEGNFINNGLDYMKPFGSATKQLRLMKAQLKVIEEISLHLDALAVQQIKQDGHDECMSFLSLSNQAEEFDFSY